MGHALTTLKLILGDQLNPEHSWFLKPRADVVFALIEMRQETDYVLHHAQKVIAIFAGMRDLARLLQTRGHRVHYLTIDDATNQQSLTGNLDALLAQYACTHFEYQEPDEWRLDQQLQQYARSSALNCTMVSSEHFYTTRAEVATLFAGQKAWLMERFYRQMRTKHNILMLDAKRPVEGKWNFDHENRKAWSGTPAEPVDKRPRHDHSTLWATIETAGVSTFGAPNAADFAWPLNRTEALVCLKDFIEDALPHFGDFQDALSTKGWRLFHSLISFALNTKMLNPREVVERAQQAWLDQKISIATAEGFIRQILGWREYIRGVYWGKMPEYGTQNYFEHTTALPKWFWTGNTKMRCLEQSLGQSLEHAYAHHIQRLMVIGNFSLLAGLNPEAVHQWYLGVYIDAFEWVELPNTMGMSQFADGGVLATKPYVSSAAYIDRQGDYCKGCYYDKKKREGERACPFNALYWDFFDRHRARLGDNFRLAMVYRNLDKMDEQALEALRAQANKTRSQLESL